MHIVGVDIGGTLLRAARFDTDLHLVDRAEQATEGHLGADHVLERLYETIRQVMPDSPDDLLGIGVGVPGPLVLEEGLVISPVNVPFKGDFPIRKVVQDAVGGPVFLGNDADLAGLAEHQMGAGQGSRNMVYLTISTGVGGGMIINGAPYRGRGLGGEVGHMMVKPGGPLCTCGQYGHVESLASGGSMARLARQRIEAGEQSSLSEMSGGDPEAIDARLIGQAAHAGDALALDIVTQAGYYLGITIASLMALLNPDLFVIGGSVTKIGDLLFEPMQRSIRESAMAPRYWQETPIIPAQLGDDAGLIGAAALVRLSKKA